MTTRMIRKAKKNRSSGNSIMGHVNYVNGISAEFTIHNGKAFVDIDSPFEMTEEEERGVAEYTLRKVLGINKKK